MTPEAARKILAEADLICSEEKSALAVRRVAAAIGERLAHSNPLVLAIMGGAVVFIGQLLPQLDFPLDFDYLQVSRYRDNTSGGQLSWVVEPKSTVAGRCVLVVDDILDEGVTLAEIRQRLFALGAAEVLTAVFADKHRDCRNRSLRILWALACRIAMYSALAWIFKVPGATCLRCTHYVSLRE